MADNMVKWLHVKTGGEYHIIGFGVREADLTPEVYYHKAGGGTTFSRPCSEFFDGRFERVNPPKQVDLKRLDVFDIGDWVRYKGDNEQGPFVQKVSSIQGGKLVLVGKPGWWDPRDFTKER